MAYDDAVTTLYQSSQTEFVAERKRLAAELKASGDKAGAARLAKLARPTLSAWAVNQLWWHAREAFDALLASSERLRQGDRGAAAAHREALLSLRGRAAVVLTDAGHAVTDGTLRRVTTTLTALAATGSFAPDAPGALAANRDPPGFDALGSVTGWSAAANEPRAPVSGAATSLAPEAAAPETSTAKAAAPVGVASSNELRGALERDGGTGSADVDRGDTERGDAVRAEAVHADAAAPAPSPPIAARAEAERRRSEAEAAARSEAERRRSEAEAAARSEAERRQAEAEAAARAQAERRRAKERAQREAARAELDAALGRARAELATGELEAARLRAELAGAEGRVARARTALRELEARSAALGAVE